MFRIDVPHVQPTRRRRASETLERHFRGLERQTVRAVARKLAARSLHVAAIDLEAHYSEAWDALHDRLLRGDEIDNIAGFLVLVTYRRALDEAVRPHPHALAAVGDAATVGDEDVIERIERRRRLRELVEGLYSELDERERAAATLCYLHGCTRDEAAQALGLSAGRMKKVMDRAAGAVGQLAGEIDAGRRCTARRSTNTAFALGVLDPNGKRMALARAHLRACPSCRADVRSVRTARQRPLLAAA